MGGEIRGAGFEENGLRDDTELLKLNIPDSFEILPRFRFVT